ncbi:hypothetical protein F5Y16DRAFT_149219 [Xylariaceae sp. FL0255]|nr:hypothetical protein F5Y16DRAFT_149219 [Xylariaceae sp. FL0255]
MGFVYRNAIITIAACNPYHVNRGFFSVNALSAETWYTPTGKPIIISRNHKWPLSQRGWVVQEQLLAPRTVHMANPVVWECREMTVRVQLSMLFHFPLEKSTKIWQSGLDKSNRLSLWNQTVTQYSTCALSKPTDKLVAIGGLARTFSGAMKTDYLAGLWRDHLIQGLNWETISPTARRLGTYRAPTWSWASIDSPIKFNYLPDKATPLMEVVQSEIVPVMNSPDGFGTPSRGNFATLLYKDEIIRVSLDELCRLTLVECISSL